MQLILFRHGIAETRGGDMPDAERALTDKGIKRTRAAAKGLATLYDPPEVIWTSPKRRARETADLLGEAFDQHPESWDLLGDGDASDLQKALRKCDPSSVILVGHEPTFSELVELLCYGDIHGWTDLKKAGCAVLDLDPGHSATLQALLPPHVLRAAHGSD